MDSLVVSKINIDEEPRLAGAEGIEDIPTLVLYRNGKAVDTLSWEHRGITHTVMGNIPYDEIMKIAEGIR